MPINVQHLKQTFEDDSTLAELYAMYVEDTTRRIEELREAVNSKKAERLSRASHALKGSSGNIGAGTMRAVAAELEKTGVEDARVIELLGTLEHEFARVEKFINDFVAHAQSAG